jgi:hypothetical protein
VACGDQISTIILKYNKEKLKIPPVAPKYKESYQHRKASPA